MQQDRSEPPQHGAVRLPWVTVAAYNAELRDGAGFAGDRASRRAFHGILARWRERLRGLGGDPLGARPAEDLGNRRLEQVLLRGDPEAAGLVLSAIEDFAQELAGVSQRLLRLPAWHGVRRIAVGGGFRASRVGELAIGRAAVVLKAAGCNVEMRPIRHDPDAAGVIGAACLATDPAPDASVLAADIGGSSIRVGVVAHGGAACGGNARVLAMTVWKHAEERPDRAAAVRRLADMARDMIARAGQERWRLAPFFCIGCPGVIRCDGAIARGGQNLPGDWEAPGFNLPRALDALLPDVGEQRPAVVLHNDAVAQGLSELPWMRDVPRWGILTIGTGLGNACFTNSAAGEVG